MENEGRAPVAVVTGAGSGIGRAIAVELGRLKMTVLLVGRRAEQLEETAALVDRACGYGVPRPCDVTDDGDLALLRSAVDGIAPCGLRALVHSAGIHALSSIEETDVLDFDAMFRVNVRGPFMLTRALLPSLRRARGDVVFINSSAAITPGANVAAYAASKAALRAFADSLRQEENAAGVRVLSVFPGRTASEIQRRLFELEGRPYDPGKLLQPDDVAATALSAISLPRTAELTELSVRPAQKS